MDTIIKQIVFLQQVEIIDAKAILQKSRLQSRQPHVIKNLIQAKFGRKRGLRTMRHMRAIALTSMLVMGMMMASGGMQIRGGCRQVGVEAVRSS